MKTAQLAVHLLPLGTAVDRGRDREDVWTTLREVPIGGFGAGIVESELWVVCGGAAPS